MAGLDANSTAPMSFELVEAEDDCVTVTINGELDISNVDALEAAVGSDH
jgi:anti-anti-sigma regulatory factor